MTEEEKKVIEYLKARLYGNEGLLLVDVAQEDLRIFLKIVENQQKGLKQADKIIEELDEEIIKKNNKIFDLECSIEKQQKEIDQLANGIRVLGTNPDITTEEIIKEFTEKPITEEYMEEFKSRYISKDKVLKAIGYEENDEEYDRLKQDDEKLLAILDTLYSEVCRLEDIEDKKVKVELEFVNAKRDKYWQDKIREKIKKLEDTYQREEEENGYNDETYMYYIPQIKVLKEMLGEL